MLTRILNDCSGGSANLNYKSAVVNTTAEHVSKHSAICRFPENKLQRLDIYLREVIIVKIMFVLSFVKLQGLVQHCGNLDEKIVG